MTRLWTGLEGSRNYTLADPLWLRPSVEVGPRHDRGDAETGAGMDVGAGLVVGQVERAGGGRAGADAAGAPGPEGFSARAVAVSLSCNPTPSAPLSFLARVAPSWGNQATRGAEALWCRETMAGMAHGSDAIGNRLDADRRRPRDGPCRGEARVGQCPPRRVSVRRYRPGSAPKPRSRSSVAPARSLPHPASPIGIGSTVAATAMPTRLSSGS